MNTLISNSLDLIEKLRRPCGLAALPQRTHRENFRRLLLFRQLAGLQVGFDQRPCGTLLYRTRNSDWRVVDTEELDYHGSVFKLVA